MTCAGSHWFAYYGSPGTSSPVCVLPGCQAPNPRYDRERDPQAGPSSELEDLRIAVRLLSELVHGDYGEDPIAETVFTYSHPTPAEAELAAVRRVTA
jgi:hypothetical protein